MNKKKLEEKVIFFIAKNTKVKKINEEYIFDCYYSFKVAYDEKKVEHISKIELGDYDYSKIVIFDNDLICSLGKDYILPLHKKDGKLSRGLLINPLDVNDLIIAKDKLFILSSVNSAINYYEQNFPIIFEALKEGKTIIPHKFYTGKIKGEPDGQFFCWHGLYIDDYIQVSIDPIVKINNKIYEFVTRDDDIGLKEFDSENYLVKLKGSTCSEEGQPNIIGVDENFLYINGVGDYIPSFDKEIDKKIDKDELNDEETEYRESGLIKIDIKSGIEKRILQEYSPIVGFKIIPKTIWENLKRS